jgi:head-tail adaptor
MPTPISLLNRLRAVSASYMMADNVQILRSESFSDEYGGTYNSYRIIQTIKARIVHKQYQEEPQGGGITNKDEYLFIFSDQVDIRFDDRIEIVDDPNTTRYFLVVGVDDVVSQGIFKTAKTEENYN